MEVEALAAGSGELANGDVNEDKATEPDAFEVEESEATEPDAFDVLGEATEPDAFEVDESEATEPDTLDIWSFEDNFLWFSSFFTSGSDSSVETKS